MKLTKAKIKTLVGKDKPYMVNDSKTLNLLVKPSGAKSWVQRISIAGKMVSLGLGPLDLVSIEDARFKAIENRKLVRDGGDPRVGSRDMKIPTFEQAAVKAHGTKTFKNPKDGRRWLSLLELYAFPVIGKVRIDQIRQDDVLRCVDPHWNEKAQTMNKVFVNIRFVFKVAQSSGFIDRNVADLAKGALKPLPKKQHLRAIDFNALPAALEKIASIDNVSPAARLSWRFAALTVGRSTQVREARWSEIDLDARLWRVPGDRMKTDADHPVPLSDAAMEVVMQAKELGDDEFLFPSPMKPGKAVSEESWNIMLRIAELNGVTTSHGLRTSFRTWGQEKTQIRPDILELCMAHQVGTQVERSYARGEVIEQRRQALDAWAGFLTEVESDKVVRIAG